MTAAEQIKVEQGKLHQAIHNALHHFTHETGLVVTGVWFDRRPVVEDSLNVVGTEYRNISTTYKTEG